MLYVEEDPLLMYGIDQTGCVMLWPTPYIERHTFTFGRWCKRTVPTLRGKRFLLNHPLSERTERWARWLGVNLEQGVI